MQLADAVKRGACSLTSAQPDSQVMVINAVKDVAAALGELINATKLASGKPINDPAMQDLKESARVCVDEISPVFVDVFSFVFNTHKYYGDWMEKKQNTHTEHKLTTHICILIRVVSSTYNIYFYSLSGFMVFIFVLFNFFTNKNRRSWRNLCV